MQEILEQIGLTKNESIMYLTLSKSGTTTAYKLAKEAGLFKANAYEALKRLLEKGLASKETLKNKCVYTASDPTFLVDLITKQKERADNLVAPLRALQNSTNKETKFNTYKGVDSFINVHRHFLEYKEPILVYGAPKQAYDLVKHRIEIFHKERIKKKIKMLHVYNFSATERIKQVKKMPYTLVKSLPELFDSNVSTSICGKEVTFTIWKVPIKTIQIIDEDMANAYKNYFKLIWANAK